MICLFLSLVYAMAVLGTVRHACITHCMSGESMRSLLLHGVHNMALATLQDVVKMIHIIGTERPASPCR